MKIKYLVPNFFTACSLISGVFALKYALGEEYIVSGWLIAVSIICDGMDGKLARILNASSRFGRYFDTISDFFAFGIVPATLVYKTVMHQYNLWGIIIVIFYVLCGAFRLTRFMRETSSSEKKNPFTGLPIPAAAGVTSALILFFYYIWTEITIPGLFIFIIPVISCLMISQIRYVAIDKKYFPFNKKIIIPGLVISIILAYKFHFIIFFIGNLIYLFYGLFKHYRSA
jgi:CDP-diacylglycerol---serine O-phosphatidyltransferase